MYDILKSGGFLQLAPDFWAGRGTIAPSVNPLLCAEKKCNAFFVCTLEIEIYTSSWVHLKSNVGFLSSYSICLNEFLGNGVISFKKNSVT